MDAHRVGANSFWLSYMICPLCVAYVDISSCPKWAQSKQGMQ